MEYLQYVPHILFLPVSHPRLSSFAPDLAATCMLYPQLTKSININSTSSQIQKASQDCSLQRFWSVCFCFFFFNTSRWAVLFVKLDFMWSNGRDCQDTSGVSKVKASVLPSDLVTRHEVKFKVHKSSRLMQSRCLKLTPYFCCMVF